MKSTVFLLLAFPLLFSCSNSTEKKEAEKEVEMISYGPTKVNVDKAISTEEMLAEMKDEKGEKNFTFEAEIAEVCSKAGCWINIKKGDGSTFMVRFKDHFTIPPKTKIGTKAYLSGVAYWDTIPVDLLKHFAEDAKKSKEEIEKITEPKFELAFESDGITFVKPKK
jgi:hypothetical protein